MKVKKAQTNWVKRLFDSAFIQIHLLVCLKFDICHIYIFQLQIFHPNVYFSQLLHSYFIELSVWHACAWLRSFWNKSVKFNGESQSKCSCASDRNCFIFPWLSNIYRWRIYLWNVSYAFRKTMRLCQGTRSLSVRASDGPSRFKLKL